MEKRYKILIGILAFFVILISSSIVVIVYINSLPLTKRPQLISNMEPTLKGINDVIDIKITPIYWTVISTNDKAEIKKNGDFVTEIVFPELTDKAQTIDQDGTKTNHLLAQASVKFYSSKPTYPNVNEGWALDPRKKTISSWIGDYEVTTYSNAEIMFNGGDGIELSDKVKTNCPKIKSYSSGYYETKEFINIDNVVFVEIAYTEDQGLDENTCEEYESTITETRKQRVNSVIELMYKQTEPTSRSTESSSITEDTDQ